MLHLILTSERGFNRPITTLETQTLKESIEHLKVVETLSLVQLGTTHLVGPDNETAWLELRTPNGEVVYPESPPSTCIWYVSKVETGTGQGPFIVKRENEALVERVLATPKDLSIMAAAPELYQAVKEVYSDMPVTQWTDRVKALLERLK